MIRPDCTEQLKALMARRILILDGAMGTMVQKHRLVEADYRGTRFAEGFDLHHSPEDHAHGEGCGCARDQRGNNDLLSLTRPDLIQSIHAQYLDAGADMVETNTFNSTTISLADDGLEHLARELNEGGARLASAAGDDAQAHDPSRPRFAIGILGPTSRTGSLSPDVHRPGFRAITFDELRVAYREAAEGLIDGGADALMVETIFDTLNATAALFAIEEVFEARGGRLPVMISGTITDASGRTLSGQTAEAFWYSVRHARPLSIGLNCALGDEGPAGTHRRACAGRRHLRQCTSQRRPAQCVRRLRRDPRRHGRCAGRIRARRAAEHRRRLLRHDPGPTSPP